MSLHRRRRRDTLDFVAYIYVLQKLRVHFLLERFLIADGRNKEKFTHDHAAQSCRG